MAGIKTYVQTDLRVPPTENTHVVRWQDMVGYVNALITENVRAALTEPFVGIYDDIALTLTASAVGYLEADGVAVVANDRVLIAGQLDKTQNGIYVVTTAGDLTTETVLTRADDFNESSKIRNGLIIPVTEGNNFGSTRWRTVVSAVPFVLDSANIEFHLDVTDTTRVVERAFEIEGDDTTVIYNFSHGWDTMNVTHELFDEHGETVVAQFRRISSNDVRVIFGIPLGDDNDLTLVIRAEVSPA